MLLSPDDLHFLEPDAIAMTAVVDGDGALHRVGGLWEKLGLKTIELAQRGLLRYVVVAADQNDVPRQYLEDDAEPLRVLKAASVLDAIQQLSQKSPRYVVAHYEREQCQWLDALGLGRPVSIATHYQRLPLLREVRRDRLPRRHPGERIDTENQDEERDFRGDFHAVDIVRWEETLRGDLITYEPVSLEQLFHHFQQKQENADSTAVPRFVVLGPPGSGKSTLLQLLAWRATKGDLRIGRCPLTPACVRLREWEAWLSKQSPGESDLPTYLAECYSRLPDPPTAELWRRWLVRGEVLVLLDGLDEIQSRPPFLRSLKDALLLFKTCPTVLSCRTVSFEQHQALCPEFPVFTLGGLPEEQQKNYIRLFFTENPKPIDAERFIEQLEALPQLKALTANPLLLNIFCYVADDLVDPILPTTRGMLYKQALLGLLNRFPLRAEIRYPGEPPNAAVKFAILGRLALQLFLGGERRLTFSSEEIHQAFSAALAEEKYGDATTPWVSALQADIVKNSGLLREVHEREFFFLHLTVQEFLVAAALASVINSHGWDAPVKVAPGFVSARGLLETKSWDPRWQEVIIFLANQLRDPLPLLKLLVNKRRDDAFGHRLALTALCLPEALSALRHDQSLVEQVTITVVSRWLQHEKNDTTAAIPHLSHALPALGLVNGRIAGVPLLQWLCQRLLDEKEDKRAGVAKMAGIMGETAAREPMLLSALVVALQESDVLLRAQATEALRWMGRRAAHHHDAPSALLHIAAYDEDTLLRRWATRALNEMGIETPLVSPQLAPSNTELHDPEPPRWNLEERAGEGTGERNLFSPERLHELVANLHVEDKETRVKAALELGMMGTVASRHSSILSALVQVALHDPDGSVRSQATESLGLIGGGISGEPQIISAIIAVLRDRDGGVRAQAAKVLGQLSDGKSSCRDIAPELMMALADEHPDVRFRAAEALERLMLQGIRIFQRWWGRMDGKTVEELSALPR